MAVNQRICQALVVWGLLSGLLIHEFAWACSCAPRDLPGIFASSENVFTAEITGGTYAGPPTRARAESARLHFRVTDRFKGDIPFTEMTTHAVKALCGHSLQVGVEYLVFIDDDGRTHLCSGTQAITGPQGGLGRQMLEVLIGHRADTMPMVDPWRFHQPGGRCRLYTLLPLPQYRHPARLALALEGVSGNGVGRTLTLELYLHRRGENQVGRPMTLQAADVQWNVPWLSTHSGRQGRYLLEGEAVLEVARTLLRADTKRMRISFAHPQHEDVQVESWTDHGRESIQRFVECVDAQTTAQP